MLRTRSSEAEFEKTVDEAGIELLRPARKGEKSRFGARFFKPLRQIIESINDTSRRSQLTPDWPRAMSADVP